VRWAISEKAKVQLCTCNYCANLSKKMGDLLSIRKLVVRETAKQPQFNNARAIIVLAEQDSWATCGSLHQRLSSCTPTWIFFGKFCCRGELSDARAIIVLREQISWATCGSLRQTTPELRPRRDFFAKFCCRGDVSGTWKSQCSTTQVPLSSRREVSGAWNSQSWTLNTSDMKRHLVDTTDKHITKRHRRSCWSKL